METKGRFVREEPLTPEEFADLRKDCQEDCFRSYGFTPVAYTCDSCEKKFVCMLVFDLYNLNGDCINDKPC